MLHKTHTQAKNTKKTHTRTHLTARPRHHLHGLCREVSVGRLSRQHDGVAAVQHRLRHVAAVVRKSVVESDGLEKWWL